MSFADTYLRRYASGFRGDFPPPNPDVSFMVVVPVYGEPGLNVFLQSIWRALPDNDQGELLFVFNYPANVSPEMLKIHNDSMDTVRSWKRKHPAGALQILILDTGPLPESKAGPGLARKIGMDLALRRLNAVNRSKGVIISLDGDTLVDQHYFRQLGIHFASGQVNTMTGYFEHLRVFNGVPTPDPEALMLYEIYLRTVRLGLRWAGYPHAFYSLGSNFAVSASAYVRAGGMGIQRSGEDFYFLNKCIPLGKFYENSQVRVFPAGRTSDRVIFGTGPFIRDFRSDYPDGLNRYSWRAFIRLSEWTKKLSELTWCMDSDQAVAIMESVHDEVVQSLGWQNKVLHAQSRSGSEASFRKWIWRELDGLQMVRYLNAHQKMFGGESIMQTAGALLSELGYRGCTQHPSLVLKELRKIDREAGVIRIS